MIDFIALNNFHRTPLKEKISHVRELQKLVQYFLIKRDSRLRANRRVRRVFDFSGKCPQMRFTNVDERPEAFESFLLVVCFPRRKFGVCS